MQRLGISAGSGLRGSANQSVVSGSRSARGRPRAALADRTRDPARVAFSTGGPVAQNETQWCAARPTCWIESASP